MILSYEQFISESIRQDIYHYTAIDALQFILKDGIMFQPNDYDHDIYSISCTRSLKFAWGGARIVLDTDMLRNRYKIQPVAFFQKKHGFKKHDPKMDQAEEIIITKDMGFLPLKYIKKIEINKKYGYNEGNFSLENTNNIPIVFVDSF